MDDVFMDDVFMDDVFNALRWAHEHGIWELASFLSLVGGISIGLKLAFIPRRRIRNLNFAPNLARNQHQQFPLAIYLQIRNYTGRSVVMSSAYIRYRDLRPPPEARGGDLPSKEFEIKFPDPANGNLTEVEYLLRHKENVQTIIPLDPTYSDQQVQTALSRNRVGSLTVTCTWLQEKPIVEKLRRRL